MLPLNFAELSRVVILGVRLSIAPQTYFLTQKCRLALEWEICHEEFTGPLDLQGGGTGEAIRNKDHPVPNFEIKIVK